jgi:predicted dehydrogenase
MSKPSTHGRKVGLAVIGLGMAAKPHLEALAQPDLPVRVTGIFNRGRARAEEMARRYGLSVFDSVEAIARDPATEGVILLTPPDSRTEAVETLANAGKHILMEKPVERTMEAAAALVRLCEARDVRLGIVFQHRFRAGARRLAEVMREGALGRIDLVRVEVPWWRDQAYYDAPGRGTYARDGGGVLISQAIHVLDLMLSLTGPAEWVQAMTATTRSHRMEAEDFAVGGVRFVSGATGSIVATTATFPGSAESIVIDGTEGTASLRAGELRVIWRDGREATLGEVSGTGGGADPMAFPCDWHRDLIVDFATAIAEDRAPAVTGREALRVHALIEAIVASSRQAGARVTVAQGEAS